MNNRSSAAPLAELLAPRFTVFAYDRRGRGDSGDTQPYAPEREFEDLEGLIDTAGGSAFVYGHSSGAALSIAVADRGASIEKLALYEPPFAVDDSHPPMPADFVPRLRELAAEGRRGDAVELFLTTGPGLPAEVVARFREAPMWAGFEAVAHTLAYDNEIVEPYMQGKPLPAEWSTSLTMPALVTDGGNSPTWMQNTTRALAGLLPNARHRSFEGQNHAVDPQQIAPVLTAFFAGG